MNVTKIIQTDLPTYTVDKTASKNRCITVLCDSDEHVIHVIETGFENRYLLVWEDAYDQHTGKVDDMSSEEVETIIGIDFKPLFAKMRRDSERSTKPIRLKHIVLFTFISLGSWMAIALILYFIHYFTT